jgi:FSR family fosmidomycin resistance protein-like MFS transporter
MFRQMVRNRALLTFMLGHFTVDTFGGLLPVLYPLMATAFGLSLADVGWIALCFTGASSLSQPFFGLAADRFGSRYLAPASIVWASVMFGIVGFSPSVTILAISAAMAGLGSGAYHPLGASNAASVTGDMQKNTAMSLYTFGGSSGYALGPVLGAVIFGLFGRQGSVALVPFGIVAAWLIYQSFKRFGLGLPEVRRGEQSKQPSIRWRPLAPVMGVSMLRNMVSLSVITFVPLWYRDMGYSVAFYGALTSAIIIGSAFGTVCGGLLADRFGQRRVLIIEMALAVPALAVFMLNPGYGGFLLGPLYGFICDGPSSVTLVMAQRLLPGRVGMASGFVLGLSFVAAGIGAPLTGSLADRIGTPDAMMIISLLMFVAIALVAFIPREALQVREVPPPPPLLAPAIDD